VFEFSLRANVAIIKISMESQLSESFSALRRRGAHSGTCSVDRMSTNPKIEKSYHLKPRIILEKNIGYHYLSFYLPQPNPTLVDTRTSDLRKVRGLRNYMTTTHGESQG
jgi:hypothetical protein